MSETSSLPFVLNEEAVTQWLESISDLAPVNTGSQLNQAFKELKKSDLADDEKLSILLKLTPATLHLSNTLTMPLKPGAQLGKQAKIAKLSLQMLRNPALVLHDLIDGDTLSLEQKLRASYFALQLIGHYLRISSLMHELPSLTLWHKSGDLFAFAYQNDLLQHNVICKISEFRQHPSIEQVLKRNILFTLVGFHRQSIADNQALFTFANQFAHLLMLDYENAHSSDFIWHYTGNAPSRAPKTEVSKQAATISVITTGLLPYLQAKSFQPPLSTLELERLTHHLTAYDKLSGDSLPSAPILLRLISGFKNVYDFLYRVEKLNRIYKLSAQIQDHSLNTDLSLEPMEHEKSLLNAFPNAKQGAKDSDIQEIGHSVKILQNKDKNFIHAETKSADFNAGDLAILVNNQNATIAGVIRHIKHLSNTQSTTLLIERIHGQLSTQSIQSGPYKDAEALLIDEQGERPEILLGFRRYHNGTEIALKGKQIRLDGVTDYSPYFVRFRVAS